MSKSLGKTMKILVICINVVITLLGHNGAEGSFPYFLAFSSLSVVNGMLTIIRHSFALIDKKGGKVELKYIHLTLTPNNLSAAPGPGMPPRCICSITAAISARDPLISSQSPSHVYASPRPGMLLPGRILETRNSLSDD